MPTAFITGPAGGLGTAIADALAPTHTLFLGGRPSDRLDALAERLGATTWPLDLEDSDAIAAAVEPIDELDVLIHNAGAAFPGRVAESTVDEWRVTMEVNVIGAVALTLALLPALRSARGHVVFINSGAGINASPGLASYSGEQVRVARLRGFAAQRRAFASGDVDPSRPDRDGDAGGARRLRGRASTTPERFLSPQTVAKVVADAVNAPPDAHIHEVVVRPTG